MGFRFRRLRYADVAATLALVVALSGGAYAVSTLPRGSVGSPQLQRGAVTAPKLSDGVVTSRSISDGTLRSRDFAEGQLGPSSGSWAAGDSNSGPQSDRCFWYPVKTSFTPKRDAQVFATASGFWQSTEQGTELTVNIGLYKDHKHVGGTGFTKDTAVAADQWEPLTDSGMVVPDGSVHGEPFRLKAGTKYTLRVRVDGLVNCPDSSTVTIGLTQLSYVLVGAPPTGW